MDYGWPVEDAEGRVLMRTTEDGWNVPDSEGLVIDDQGATAIRFQAITKRLSRVTVTKSLLRRFVNLGDASDRAIAAYAKRWGPLTLYQHQDSLLRHRLPPLDLVQPAPVSEETLVGPHFDEPVAMWRSVVEKAQAMLLIARQIHDGQAGAVEAWRVLDGGDAPSEFEVLTGMPNPDGEPISKPLLATRLNAWLQIGHVIPRINWYGAAPEPLHQLGGLCGALAHELLNQVTKGADLFSCSLCGKNYFRTARRPRAGQSNYCPTCQANGGAARGQARRRREERAQRRLAEGGTQ